MSVLLHTLIMSSVGCIHAAIGLNYESPICIWQYIIAKKINKIHRHILRHIHEYVNYHILSFRGRGMGAL